MYRFNQERFDKTFIAGGKFQHQVLGDKCKYHLFPFSANSKSDKIIDSFDGILGPFLRAVFDWSEPEPINRDEIIESICSEVSITLPADKNAFKQIIKEMYFESESSLKYINISTHKYSPASAPAQHMANYLVSTLCKKAKLKSVLETREKYDNILDELVLKHLPLLTNDKTDAQYAALYPSISENFVADFTFLLENNSADFTSFIQLISYYYFFYTSQVMICLHNLCGMRRDIRPIYFCLQWEKTSRNRECFKSGWRQLEVRFDEMLSHAVLLEMINQTDNDSQKYCYDDLYNEFSDSSPAEQHRIFGEIMALRTRYRTEYAAPDTSWEYSRSYITDINLSKLVREFFNDIMLQFQKSERKRANDAYQKSFKDFCKNNFLQRRGAAGFMLTLSEEQLLLMTKVAIGRKEQLKLNDLFKEFENRGLYFDNSSKDSIVEFYEKLNLIEKKSDSGDAQYVKGVL